MTLRKYADFNFNKDRLRLIDLLRFAIEEYAKGGIHHLSVRQLHYWIVSRDPEQYPNTEQTYNRVGSAISDGRMAGLISWDVIEDRNRGLAGYRYFDNVTKALQATKDDYKTDMWLNQPMRPEVWIEKAALEGVVGSICGELRVDFLSLRGYNSQSEQWRAGRRFAEYIRKGQTPIVLHLGDHDPSGIDMTRDNRERLELFAGVPIVVDRIALNMGQIRRYNPPPNFVKATDSRSKGYLKAFGTDDCWELDALDPKVIRGLIESAVLAMRDETLWLQAEAKEAEDLRELEEIISGDPTDAD